MNRRHYMRIVDLIGVLAIISSVTYLLISPAYRPNERLDGLWGNISSELIGIWLAVRLIEWAVRQHDSALKVRVRSVRNLRMLENQLLHFIDSGYLGALRRLDFEIAWCKGRIVRRSKYLDPDEINDVSKYYEILDKIRSMLPEISDYSSREEIKDIIIGDEFSSLMASLANARKKAEDNILEETDEDEGLMV